MMELSMLNQTHYIQTSNYMELGGDKATKNPEKDEIEHI